MPCCSAPASSLSTMLSASGAILILHIDLHHPVPTRYIACMEVIAERLDTE